MKIAAIDVGSNSVRLGVMADGKTLYKRLNTTRLGEGLAKSGLILPVAMERTAKAIAEFYNFALQEEGCQTCYVFATAAVRSATNRQEFLTLVQKNYGITVDVVSGEEEAKLGMFGVLSAFPTKKGEASGIIDVGGASTEITVQTSGNIFYTKSVNIGSVRLFDLAGRNRQKLLAVIDEKIAEYGNPFADFQGKVTMYGIGGTATTIASTLQKLPVYLPEKVNGFTFSQSDLGELATKLLNLSVEEVRALQGMEPKRADLIGGGALLLWRIMEKLNLSTLSVSESDNIEGYILRKEGI
jgi:exopolyphosphatase/guanosine-5'-triphosphate,3'-diphosphate pyrophosphatase